MSRPQNTSTRLCSATELRGSPVWQALAGHKRRIPLAVVLPRPARGAGTLIPSAQRFVLAAKQALGKASCDFMSSSHSSKRNRNNFRNQDLSQPLQVSCDSSGLNFLEEYLTRVAWGLYLMYSFDDCFSLEGFLLSHGSFHSFKIQEYLSFWW